MHQNINPAFGILVIAVTLFVVIVLPPLVRYLQRRRWRKLNRSHRRVKL